MKALFTTAVIHVADMKSAVSYYVDVLGFKVDFEFGDYRGLSYGDLQIHLNGPTYQGMKKVPGSAHFCIYCDEVDAYYNTIMEKGALIIVPIGDRLYSQRDFTVNDNDGNTLVFGTESK